MRELLMKVKEMWPSLYPPLKRTLFPPSPSSDHHLQASNMLAKFGLGISLKAYLPFYPSVWVSLFTPPEIFHAMKILPFSVEMASTAIAGLGFNLRFLQRAENNLYLRDTCSFCRCVIGMALEGLLPPPRALVSTSLLCEGTVCTFEQLSKLCGGDYFLLEVPYESNSSAVEYLAYQFQELVKFLEHHTGRKLSPRSLEEAIVLSNQARNCMLKVNDLRRTIPSPMSGIEALGYVVAPTLGLGTKRIIDIYRKLAEELERRIETGRPAVEREKIRLLWLHLKPYYSNQFIGYVEDNSFGSVIAFEEFNYIYWEEMDPGEPYISLARKTLSHHANGSIERRVEAISKMVDDYSIDGVIHFSHWGCRQSCGGVRLIKDALAKKGIPFLVLDGDCLDSRNYSEAQTRTRFEGFLEILEK